MKRYGQLYACPRFAKCGANICPLDPDWRLRSQGEGEPVCFYLLEAVKDGAQGRFERSATGNIYSGVVRVLPEMVSTVGTLRRATERAKLSGSRMDRTPPVRRAA